MSLAAYYYYMILCYWCVIWLITTQKLKDTHIFTTTIHWNASTQFESWIIAWVSHILFVNINNQRKKMFYKHTHTHTHKNSNGIECAMYKWVELKPIGTMKHCHKMCYSNCGCICGVMNELDDQKRRWDRLRRSCMHNNRMDRSSARSGLKREESNQYMCGGRKSEERWLGRKF